MGKFSWKWPVILAVTASVATVSYSRLDPKNLVWFGLQTLFQLILLTLGINCVCTKLYRALAKWKSHDELTQADTEVSSLYNMKTKTAREEAQSKFDEQADSYKERILIPRDEAKKKKKEEEFLRFMGPAWKGKGDKLGGDEAIPNISTSETANRTAGEVRQLPSTVQLHVPRQQPTTVVKRVIEVPAEPPDTCTDTTTVVLRTPIGTTHRRRFLHTHTLQAVLDYMTTLGFSQHNYTLSRSYPRQPLTHHASMPLSDLDFGRQVILNVEEKDV